MSSKLPRLVVRSRSANEREEESIYRVAPLSPGQKCAPIIKTYNIAPETPSGTAVGMLPKMHADSSQIQGIMNQPIQAPPAPMRTIPKPTDHTRSNVAAIKELSSLNKLKKQQEAENSRAAKPVSASRSTSAPSRRVDQHSSESTRDYVRENRLGAAAPIRPPRPVPKGDDGMKYLQKKDFGRVPTYLLDRKIEGIEKQEAELRAKEAALIPPGMRMMPEEERLQTLAVLQRNRQEMERAMQGLPLKIETLGQRRRRDEMEQRMQEIEEGLKVFSKPKVLVRY